MSFRGSVRALAPANPYAWEAEARVDPRSGADLARSFPGAGGGDRTSVLAAAITREVIQGADLLIDLHSAGVAYEMPFFAGFAANRGAPVESERAARAFGAPLIWEHSQVAMGRTLTVAADLGIPAIYVECSGGGSVLCSELESYVDGVYSVMAAFGFLPNTWSPERAAVARRVRGDGDLSAGATADEGGFFVQNARGGASVSAGDLLGKVYGIDGGAVASVKAPEDGIVMFIRRKARIAPGDVLFVLGKPACDVEEGHNADRP